ncbi:MAG: hypothetical protein PHR45_03200 [Muribaculaceae bacterium]|nr:hypothetical protein [Muribaculaceae bacterium]
MSTYVYSNSNVKLSKDEFNKVYTLFSYEGTGKLINNTDASSVAGTNAIRWELTPEDVGTISATTNTKDVYVKAIFTDPNGIKAPIHITFKATVKINVPVCVPALKTNWYDNDIFPVLPAPYKAGETCTYNNNLWLGFNYGNGILVSGNMLSGGLDNGSAWDLQFAMNAINGYTSYTGTEPADKAGYNLSKNGTAVASLAWNAGHSQWGAYALDKSTNVVLENNSDAIALLNPIGATKNIKSVKMGIWVKINKWNTRNVKSYYLQFIEPLKITNTLSEGKSFTDMGTNPSKIDLDDAFDVKDAYGNTVSTNDKLKP